MPNAHDGLDPFYPIVPDAAWVRRLVARGTRCIQLRIKDKSPDDIRCEIIGALDAAAPARATIIVNDHWREALDVGATYVHLGQEDLDTTDIKALKAKGIRIGLSTHTEAELTRALAHQPDYIALGPIYPTQSKSTGHDAQGLDRIREWKQKIGAMPLVAIGGITFERAPAVIAAGARSVAVISDVTAAIDPDTRIDAWVKWAKTAM